MPFHDTMKPVDLSLHGASMRTSLDMRYQRRPTQNTIKLRRESMHAKANGMHVVATLPQTTLRVHRRQQTDAVIRSEQRETVGLVVSLREQETLAKQGKMVETVRDHSCSFQST